MAPEDAALFIEVEDEANGEGRESQGSWLRFLEYGEGSTQSDDNNETNKMAEEDKEVESKTDRIKKSFSSATPVHKEKPDLVAECVWEILPDEDACCFDYGMIVCSLVAADV